MEDLSEMLEKPIEAENIPALRQHVTDKTVRITISVYFRVECFMLTTW